MRMIRQDQLMVEDLDAMVAKGREEQKNEEDPNNATNYPDDKSRPGSKSGSKVQPEAIAEEEDDNLKTE